MATIDQASSPATRSAAIAKAWLDKQWESSGPKSGWTATQWDKYHEQLGLLFSFLEDLSAAQTAVAGE